MAFGDGLSWYPLTERAEWRNSYYNDTIDEIQSFYSGTLDGSDFVGPIVLSEPGQHLQSYGAELWNPQKIFGLDVTDPLNGETDRFVSNATGWCDVNLVMGTTGHDSTTELQNALDNGLSNDAALIIPPGIYETATGWTLPDADRVYIKGFGTATTLKATADGLTLLAFNASATSDITIEDITFDGGGNYGVGLFITAAKRVRIKNCTFQNFTGGVNVSEEATGIKIDFAEGVAQNKDVIIEGCKFIDCNPSHANSNGHGIWYYDAHQGVTYPRHLITNCQFISDGGTTGSRYGIHMDTVNDWRISNCQFVDLDNGINLEKHNNAATIVSDGLSITHCLFSNCKNVGVRLYADTASPALTSFALKRVTIAGCLFTMPTPGSSVGVMLRSHAVGGGAPYERLTEIICTENLFDNLNIPVHVRGLDTVSAVTSMVDSLITHNTVWRGAEADGIRLDDPAGAGDAKSNIIAGNIITGLIYLLRLTGSSCSDNILFGNVLGGDYITHINDSGTDTRKAHNALADLTGE